jgi:hypothetical protein
MGGFEGLTHLKSKGMGASSQVVSPYLNLILPQTMCCVFVILFAKVTMLVVPSKGRVF